MIRINNIKISASAVQISSLEAEIRKLLRIKDSKTPQYRIIRKSIDARKKDALVCIYTVDVMGIAGEEALVRKLKKDNVRYYVPEPYPETVQGEIPMKTRPVIVGAGPAGLFAAYTLAKRGYRPVLLERGADVDTRTTDVANFWKTGKLNTASNVQFGEGGAGTFSDGKVNSGITDPRCQRVLETFVEQGASEEILYQAKPHIGTDVLKQVVKNLRLRIIESGGDVRFYAQVTDYTAENGRLAGLQINGQEWIKTDCVVLAIGHSARDTFAMLHKKGLKMEPKAFAVGVRMEHCQRHINRSQYGMETPYAHMGAADYKLTYQTETGRSVYSFCMCPGGQVVAAASEEGRLAVNGMSYHARDGRNANAALVVNVSPTDFEGQDVLAGVEFQRRLEEKAYEAGRSGGSFFAPVQLYGDFVEGKVSDGFGRVIPTYMPGTTFADLNEIFPSFITDAIKEAMPFFGRRIEGYDDADAVMTAVESRTSSPVRIVRDKENLQSENLAGLYPCGEGAGYAGGIMSAAVDGIRVAEQIIRQFAPLKE